MQRLDCSLPVSINLVFISPDLQKEGLLIYSLSLLVFLSYHGFQLLIVLILDFVHLLNALITVSLDLFYLAFERVPLALHFTKITLQAIAHLLQLYVSLLYLMLFILGTNELLS